MANAAGWGRRDGREGAQKIDIRLTSSLACKAQRFLLYFGMDASSSILCAICVDRFIAVWLPHKKTRSLVNVFWAIAALLSASAAFNVHVFWTRGEAAVHNPRTNATVLENCGYPKKEYRFYWENYHGWLMLAYYVGVPFIIMAVLNSLVAYKLRAQNLLLPGRGRSRDDFRLTVMLLSASLFFFIFTAPAAVYNTVETTFDRATQRRLKVVDAYATMLQYANHAVHFYVYLSTGRGFRRDACTCSCVITACRRRADRSLPSTASGNFRSTSSAQHSAI